MGPLQQGDTRCRGAIRAADPGDQAAAARGPGARGSSRPVPTPPDLEEFLRRSQDRLRTVLPGGLGGKGIILIVLAAVAIWGFSGLLPCRPRRTRRGAALRQICARGAARTELSPAVSDRDGAHAQGAARQQDRHRHAHRRGSPPRHYRSATCRKRASCSPATRTSSTSISPCCGRSSRTAWAIICSTSSSPKAR